MGGKRRKSVFGIKKGSKVKNGRTMPRIYDPGGKGIRGIREKKCVRAKS